MAYRNLIIPGHTTALDDHPEFQVIALSNQPLTVMIKYLAEKTPERTVFGEITFISVLEYCWTAYFVEYEDIREHESDYEFGLIEILDKSEERRVGKECRAR